eukprot:COSAG01_NODE_2855_length_6961_cov_3.612260_5_plen_72_part_00
MLQTRVWDAIRINLADLGFSIVTGAKESDLDAPQATLYLYLGTNKGSCILVGVRSRCHSSSRNMLHLSLGF